MEQHQSIESVPPHAEVAKVETDFDKSEPRALLIAGLGIGTIIGLVVVLLGVQAYFDHIKAEATYEKVLVPVSGDLKNIHTQEDEELNTYKYLDRNQGVVQIPISRAMQLLTEEAGQNKLKYFRKSTPVKVPVAAPAAGGTAVPAGSAPAGSAPATAPGSVQNAPPANTAGAQGSGTEGQKLGNSSASSKGKKL
jgi:hypothetical protein